MVWVNIDFVEVSDAGLEDLDLSETDGLITRQSDPEMTTFLCVLEVFPAGGFRQDRLRVRGR
jgi:hypothetical protein